MANFVGGGSSQIVWSDQIGKIALFAGTKIFIPDHDSICIVGSVIHIQPKQTGLIWKLGIP